jgi:hypothetical protein
MSRRYKNTAVPEPVPAPVPGRRQRCDYSNPERTTGTARDAAGRRVDFRLIRGAMGRVIEIHASDVLFKNE